MLLPGGFTLSIKIKVTGKIVKKKCNLLVVTKKATNARLWLTWVTAILEFIYQIILYIRGSIAPELMPQLVPIEIVRDGSQA